MATPMKFSVITATLNRLEFLKKCTASVLDQGYEHVEHVIVDGASRDGTVEFLKNLSAHHGEKVRWSSRPDGGISEAINTGLSMATGDVLSWMGSDDALLPGALRSVHDYLTGHPGALWLYGSGDIVDERGCRVRVMKARAFDRRRFVRTCLFFGPSVFVRRELALRVGPLREDLKYAMDYEWYLRLMNIAAPHKLDERLACFGWHRGSVTSGQRLAQLDETREISKAQARGGLERTGISALYFFYKTRAWARRSAFRMLKLHELGAKS